MLDWNWYFSSLAQSTAAVVGIFGAFIITKILSNQSEYSQKKSQLKELLIRSQRLTDDAEALAFSWYVKRTNEEELDNLREIWETGDLSTSEELYDQLNFSIFFPREKAIELISQLVTSLNEQKIKYEDERLRQGRLGGCVSPTYSLSNSLRKLERSNPSLQGAIDKERESIDFVFREIRSNIRAVNHFLRVSWILCKRSLLMVWHSIVELNTKPIQSGFPVM